VEQDRTAAVLAEIEEATARFAGTVADGIGDAARSGAPVATGELAGGIGVERDGDGWLVVAGSPHSIYVELGTRHMPAQPFLLPAVDSRDPWAAAVADIR
jgi:HK97 gp10 family phage protein